MVLGQRLTILSIATTWKRTYRFLPICLMLVVFKLLHILLCKHPLWREWNLHINVYTSQKLYLLFIVTNERTRQTREKVTLITKSLDSNKWYCKTKDIFFPSVKKRNIHCNILIIYILTLISCSFPFVFLFFFFFIINIFEIEILWWICDICSREIGLLLIWLIKWTIRDYFEVME